MNKIELEYKKFRRDLKNELYKVNSKTRSRTVSYYDEKFEIEKENFFKVVKQTPKEIAHEISIEQGQSTTTKMSSMLGRIFLYMWSGVYLDVVIGGVLAVLGFAFMIAAPLSGIAYSIVSLIANADGGLVITRVFFGLALAVPLMYLFSMIGYATIYVSRIVWTYTCRFFWNKNPNFEKYLPIEKLHILFDKKILVVLAGSIVILGILLGIQIGVYGLDSFNFTF